MRGAGSTTSRCAARCGSAPVTMAVSLVAARRVTVYLFVIVPKGFLPSEDQGRFNVNTEGAQGISFEDMVDRQLKVADIVMAEPEHLERRRRTSVRSATTRPAVRTPAACSSS